jgi:hypothetical protein
MTLRQAFGACGKTSSTGLDLWMRVLRRYRAMFGEAMLDPDPRGDANRHKDGR